VVSCDPDAASYGPREQDLISVRLEYRYGRPLETLGDAGSYRLRAMVMPSRSGSMTESIRSSAVMRSFRRRITWWCSSW